MSIEIKNLYHIYFPGSPLEKIALNNINLYIPSGQFLGIAGHTGSGKSTLVQHLNGLLKATKGTIMIDGIDLSGKNTDLKRIRKKVGLVFQYPEHQLFEDTVYKDISFGPLNFGIAEDKVELIVKSAMALVGLDYDGFKDQNPFQLSGGQRRRVAIAGVLAQQPEVLVLDEPTAGLDPKGREAILAMIKKLHTKQSLTIILVSHSMEDLARFAEKIIIMEKGEIVLSGPPKEVFRQSQKLKQAGLGIPLITELMLQLKARGLPVAENIITVSEGVEEIKKLVRGFN